MTSIHTRSFVHCKALELAGFGIIYHVRPGDNVDRRCTFGRGAPCLNRRETKAAKLVLIDADLTRPKHTARNRHPDYEPEPDPAPGSEVKPKLGEVSMDPTDPQCGSTMVIVRNNMISKNIIDDKGNPVGMSR